MNVLEYLRLTWGALYHAPMTAEETQTLNDLPMASHVGLACGRLIDRTEECLDHMHDISDAHRGGIWRIAIHQMMVWING